MTPDDIAKLRALCEQATQPGPWTVNVNDIGKDGDGHCVVLDAHGMWVADCGNAPADAAFIAAARSALPQLLDECESLRRERDEAREANGPWAESAAESLREADAARALANIADECRASAERECDRLSARVAELEAERAGLRLDNERLSMRPTTSTELQCEGLRGEAARLRKLLREACALAESALPAVPMDMSDEVRRIAEIRREGGIE